jgi:hypothetical protein
MSCSPFELRDYFLNELKPGERRLVEAHARGCEACREELDRLRLTEAALLGLRDEEMPRRIGFVASAPAVGAARGGWWSAIWNSGPKLGFASAAMLSAALLVFALRPAQPQQTASQVAAYSAQPTVAPAAAGGEVAARVQAAVEKAVAASEMRQQARNEQLVQELQDTRKRLLLAAEEFDYYQKKSARLYAASYQPKPDDAGGTR